MPQGTTEQWVLTPSQLTQFGARLKQEHSFPGSDYEVGCHNAAVDFKEVKQVLEGRRSIFEQRYLIFLATENTSLINWDGQGHAMRKNLLQGSDGVFGSAAERDFYLGRRHASSDAFIQEFGSLKPCMQGSDAHEPDRIGQPVNNRFCWVKADPTFDGLRQTIFEPAERIFLGDQPPQLKHGYKVIQSVCITAAPDWFSFSPIPLNSDLVTIIGGKGAGKSALSELIAFAGGSEVFRGVKLKELQDTFLAKACKRSPSNLRTIIGATVTLLWADGTPTTATVNESLDHEKNEERVKYLPQKFVERMCAAENHTELIKEVERVIFNRIPVANRLGASAFADLKNVKTKRVQIKRTTLIEQLTELNKEVFTLFMRFNTKEEKTKSLQLALIEAQSLAANKPDTTSASQADLDRFAELQALQKDLQTEEATHLLTIATVEEIEARFSSMSERVHSFNAEIESLLSKVGLRDESADLRLSMPDRLLPVLNVRKQQTDAIISTLKHRPEDGLEAVTAELTSVSEKLALSQTKRAEFEKFEKDRQAIKNQITALESEVDHIDTVLAEELRVKREQRRDKYLDFFVVLQEEKEALDGLYAPLRTALASGNETDRKLQFDSRIAFDIEDHATNGCELFDNRRRGRFKDKDLLVVELRKLLAELETASFERSFSKERITAFRERFLEGEDGQAITIKDQLKRSKTEEDFNNWFYSLEPYSVEYSITFEGRNLALLSPGQKGIVLLLVYLEIDQDDQRPLVIDQPEDNLDNLSVYSNLIQFFRKRKCSRQIILVTHNPNLVVNTDSEQIIVATYDANRNPRIAYRAGALEETMEDPPGVREQVCAILEGGSEAFRKREEKYSLV